MNKDINKILLLAVSVTAAITAVAQHGTMLVRTTNGAVMRTDVSDVNKITFSDTTYNVTASGDRILSYDEVRWPDDRLIPQFLKPATRVRTLDMNAASLSDAERLMFCTLEGIVNRTRPRILLYNHQEEPQNTWPQAHSLKALVVAPAYPYRLVSFFKDEVKGLVLYSTEKSEHYANLAATIAGLEDLLPVTAEIQEKLVANGIDLPVVEDLTSLTMTTAANIYNYLHTKYWSRCNHRLLVSERPGIPYVHDIAAATGAAVVWLDPRNNAEKVVLDKFLKDLTPGRDIVLGWYAEERSGIGEATRYGLCTVPADFFENATIYSGVKKAVVIPPVPKRPKLENKVYAAVYISDGDNIQYCQHAMVKIFAQSGRGKMPLNWTISPALADFSPAMLNYYYRRATTNDCFVSGPSGLGYAMPYDAFNKKWNSIGSSVFTPYTKLTQRYLEKAGLRVITVWDNVNKVQRDAYADHCPYLYGVTVQDWERQTGRIAAVVQKDKLAFVPNYPCYANGVDVITDFFNRDIKNFDGTAPMFVSGQATVWDAGPDKLVELKTKLDALSPGNVNIVRADHFFSYYNEAHHLPFDLTMMDSMKISTSEARNAAALAADGSPSEKYMWVSATNDSRAWLHFDFGEPFSISRFVARHAEAAGLEPGLNTRAFTVETSLDGTNWTAAATVADNTSAVTDLAFEARAARYVRMTITNAGDDGTARIADVEIYGSH